ncbi:MAG: serine/threonine-protein kinase, partial [Opitutales bacterium]
MFYRIGSSPKRMDLSEQILLKAGQSFGQFEIIDLIGTGGMGQVYKARHTTLEAFFALKILHPDITKNPTSIFRLRMEARTAFRLKHPNILNIEEFNEVDGHFYLRMPLMTGLTLGRGRAVSLSELLTLNGGKLPETDAAVIMHDILQGLTFAHGNGVIHRDIKPANILFDGSRAVISDFGLVRVVGEDFFRSRIDETVAVSKLGSGATGTSAGSNSLLGTYNYMSPEQKLGAEADERSDVYAAGLIALDMLTGRTSFGMKAPSKSVKGLSQEWDSFLEKALEPDAADRFQSALDMLEAFPGIAGNARVLTGRATPKSAKKTHKGSRLLLIGALTVAALGATGALLYQQGLFKTPPAPVIEPAIPAQNAESPTAQTQPATAPGALAAPAAQTATAPAAQTASAAPVQPGPAAQTAAAAAQPAPAQDNPASPPAAQNAAPTAPDAAAAPAPGAQADAPSVETV